MKTKTLAGTRYVEYPNGVLVPETLLREPGKKLITAKDALPFLQPLAFAPVECVVVLTLDGNNQVINTHDVIKGVANQCQMHPRETFLPAITDRACSIIVAHNHPSGNLEASDADIVATKRMNEVSKVIGIPVLDHIIVTQAGHASIRERYPYCFG